ncbi:PIN domain protein [Beggiatoa sp. PS]|nr:PIN domain protein [Beggiatoa sp. PS]
MILCDTDILIEFYKNNPQIFQELSYIKPQNMAISAITQAELYFGALNKIELEKIKRHLSGILCIPLDRDISKQFLQLMETYALSHKLGLPDAIIAATALVHHMELYTRNIKDFRFIAGIQLYQTVSY